MTIDRGPGGNGSGGGAQFYAAAGTGYQPPAPPGPSGYAPEPEAEGMTLRDALGVLWRRKWVILVVIVVATASAYFFSSRQTSMYEAEATIIYKQQIDLSNPLDTSGVSNTNLDREIASIDGLLQGPNLQQRITALLAKDGSVNAGTKYEVSAAPEQNTDTASSTTSTNVVVFTGSSSSPAMAAASANAAANAYVDWNAEFQRTQITKAIPVIQNQLQQYDTAASRVSADYLLLKQRLQDLQILKATATGNYQLLAPATLPESPVSPKPLRDALLGFGVGLFAGIGLAFLLEQFDTRVRTLDQVAALLRQPVLGRVPRISRKFLGESALVALKHPDSPAAEAFRMVRTNLDFMAVDSETRAVVVTSCLQGEGKSVTVANLAVSMAMAGKRIIVVDADLRRPRQHAYFGLDNAKGLSTVVAGRHSLAEALVRVDVGRPEADGVAPADDPAGWSGGVEGRSALYVLPSGPIPPNPGEIVASRRSAAVLDELCREADLVLVDTPAMLAVGDTSAVAAKVDGLVFLVDLHQVRRPQLVTAAQQLARLPVRLLGTVVRMEGAHGGAYYQSSYHYSYSQGDDGSRLKLRGRGAAAGRPAQDRMEV